MIVWVLYDAMNEMILGVFSTEELAQEAAQNDPQSPPYLGIEEFVVDSPRSRS